MFKNFWIFLEQVLHRVQAEQGPKRGPDEAVRRPRGRKTYRQIDAWVPWSACGPDGRHGLFKKPAPLLVIIN